MVFLIDPGDLMKGGGCQDKGCGTVCKSLCPSFCGPKIIPMYGIPPEEEW